MPFTALPPAQVDFIGLPPMIGGPALSALPVAVALPDAYNGGSFQVVGTTKVKGSPDFPVSRRVRLHDQLSGRVVREQWSQAGSGAYAFLNIRAGVWYVTAFDHTKAYNGVLATDVSAEPMP